MANQDDSPPLIHRHEGASPTPSSSTPISTLPSTSVGEYLIGGASPSSSSTIMVQDLSSTPSASTSMAPCPRASFTTKFYNTFFAGPSLYSVSTSVNIYFHYYDYIDHTFIMSTDQEGLGEHIKGPITPNMKTLCPVLTRKPRG
jgi:hypothetical protein